MVESSSNSFYSFIRSASFGIEMNLLEELDFVANNKDSSDIQIANCTSSHFSFVIIRLFISQ